MKPSKTKEHNYASDVNAACNPQLILDALDPLITTTSMTGSNTSKEYQISSSYEQADYKQSNENDNMLPNMHYYCGDYVDMDVMNEISKELLDSDIISTMNNNIDITSRNNIKTTNKLDINKSNTKQNKKAKRKKLKKKNKQCMNDGIGYDPNPSFRAKGHIKISKELTEEIIPSRIKEKISNIYCWMDKWSALIHNACTEYMDGNIRILNYGFHDKNTNKMLYCIAIKQDILSKSSRGYQWCLRDGLYADIDIKREYKINADKLPQCNRFKLKFTAHQYYKNKLENVLGTEEKHNYLLQNTAWHKLRVYNKKNNKERMVLYITKPEFMKKLRMFMDSKKDEIELVPIMMFNANSNDCWSEFIWIVRIAEGIDIGVAFKYNEQIGEFRVNGIHLNKQYLQSQHDLISVDHQCNCFNNFTSKIDNLEIGNPDDERNRMNYYKQQCEQKIEAFESQSIELKQVKTRFDKKTEAFNQQTVELERQRVECERMRATLEKQIVVFEKQTAELMQYKQYSQSLEAQLARAQAFNASCIANQHLMQYSSATNNSDSFLQTTTRTTRRNEISGYNTSGQNNGYQTFSNNRY